MPQKGVLMTEQRFNANGSCRCERIVGGECRQCSACDECDFFVANITPIPYTYMWGGEMRDSFPHGARYYIGKSIK